MFSKCKIALLIRKSKRMPVNIVTAHTFMISPEFPGMSCRKDYWGQ